MSNPIVANRAFELIESAAVTLRYAAILLILSAQAACAPSSPHATPVYGYSVVQTYPHDSSAFTEGLLYHEGSLYESTGLKGMSSIRKVNLETGRVEQRRDLPANYFGEGIAIRRGQLLQLTYTTQIGFVYDLVTFEPRSEFTYTGEGWALAGDGQRLVMSDGTSELRFLDFETLQETRRLPVTEDGMPVKNLNELEWVKGEIFANIWHSDRIARIDPASGKVTGWIDLTGLLTPSERADPESVLNGIAWDAAGERLFVTGKRWPKLFQIRVLVR
jgi:glutamine cyclotransferase